MIEADNLTGTGEAGYKYAASSLQRLKQLVHAASLFDHPDRSGCLQDVRYVIHTITFCAVFGCEKGHFSIQKLYFYFENYVFQQNFQKFKVRISKCFRFENLKN